MNIFKDNYIEFFYINTNYEYNQFYAVFQTGLLSQQHYPGRQFLKGSKYIVLFFRSK